MQITTFNQQNRFSIQPRKAVAGEFQPAGPTDLVSITTSFESQDRFDGGVAGQIIGGMVGGGLGALGAGVGGALLSAAAGSSGWGVALTTIGGAVGGGLVGAYLGSR